MVEWLVNHPGFSEVSVTTKSMRLFETQQAKEARQQEIERGMEKAQVGLQTSLVIIDPSLRNQVAIDTSSLTVPWPLESKQQHRDILWLGHGHSAGLSGVLWSREHRKVLLHFYLTPGPGQNDKLCSVQLSGLANGHVRTGVRRLNESTRLDFPLSLKPGHNHFLFSASCSATFPVHESRDSQERIVGLHLIFIQQLP